MLLLLAAKDGQQLSCSRVVMYSRSATAVVQKPLPCMSCVLPQVLCTARAWKLAKGNLDSQALRNSSGAGNTTSASTRGGTAPAPGQVQPAESAHAPTPSTPASTNTGPPASKAVRLPPLKARNIGMCALKGIGELVELFEVTEG
jgi:hypothetical protein